MKYREAPIGRLAGAAILILALGKVIMGTTRFRGGPQPAISSTTSERST